MKNTTTILLVALFLLPIKFSLAQNSEPKPLVTPTVTPVPSPSPTASEKKIVQKTGSSSKIKIINRPPPPTQYNPDKLPFLPPSPYFIPSTKVQVNVHVMCSDSKFMWIYTQSFTPLFMSFVKFDEGGQILVLQDNGEYVPYPAIPTDKPSSSRPEDVKTAEKIIKDLKPKRLTLMPKLVSFEKSPLALYDPYQLVEILRDHFGREGYDVNVMKDGNCYKMPPPTPSPTPTPSPSPSLTPTPTPVP